MLIRMLGLHSNAALLAGYVGKSHLLEQNYYVQVVGRRGLQIHTPSSPQNSDKHCIFHNMGHLLGYQSS